MTELSIDPGDITKVLRERIGEYSYRPTREQVGRVLESGDGIAQVSGLPNLMANELVDLGTGPEGQRLMGLALSLEEDTVGVVILGEGALVEEGDEVRPTGDVLSVPVGDAYLGRVVDPLGRPLDGKGPLDEDKIKGRRGLEVQAPSVVDRQPVKEPLQTGIKAIDAMTPIGRGQRELIIGDRQTGKTAVALDTIINQRQLWGSDRQVKCVYVAIGQKATDVAEVVARLQEHGAMEYTVVVSAPAASPAPFKYIAPYAGCAIGAHWMYDGGHGLIVYDDLSKHADAYRQLSLLLRRPPGREAYPGDVFYLHSRLLERGAKLSDDLGGGSLTALPIIETKGGDVSAYIPTNVISITDGQIYLETDLFFQGVRPAINVGISVSRVGGDAQVKAMKQVSGTIRLDLAQYRELEDFAQFGSELDKSSQAQLERGERIVEILKQPQNQPVPVEEQIAAIWAVSNDKMDDVPVEDAKRFEQELREFLRDRHNDLLEQVRSDGQLGDDRVEKLDQAVEEFRARFQPSQIAEEDEGKTLEDLAEQEARESDQQETDEGAEAQGDGQEQRAEEAGSGDAASEETEDEAEPAGQSTTDSSQ